MAAHGIAIMSPASTAKMEPMAGGRTALRKALLACGIAAPLLSRHVLTP